MSTEDDYGQGVNIASLTDAPDASRLAKDIANALAQHSLMRFASASARGATLSGSTPPVDGMATWLQDTDSLEVYNGSAWVTPQPALTSTTSGLSAASGFSVVEFYGFRQGRFTTLDMFLNRTGGNLALASGNLPDTVCCTAPAGWRPTHGTINGAWDNGISGGGFVIGTDGICTLRTSDGTIESGTNLRLHIAFLKTT